MKIKMTAVTVLAVFLFMAMMITTLGSCEKNDTEVVSSEPSEVVSDTGRKDGERFEKVIILEGEEETVRYEHIRNEEIGFELDFDYDLLERRGSSDTLFLTSRYDDLNQPENYLEVTFRNETPDTVAASVKASLSKKFGKVKADKCTLDNAGECNCIGASKAKKGNALQTAYLIPANGGCLVATVHCTIESAEGFGARLTDTVNTVSVIAK